MVLGEMDVARANPYHFGQGQPPVHSALDTRLFSTGVQRLCGIARPDVIPCVLVGMTLTAVALKSKAFTYTIFFSDIFLTRHDRKMIASALVARAPFRDFRLKTTLGSGDV